MTADTSVCPFLATSSTSFPLLSWLCPRTRWTPTHTHSQVLHRVVTRLITRVRYMLLTLRYPFLLILSQVHWGNTLRFTALMKWWLLVETLPHLFFACKYCLKWLLLCWIYMYVVDLKRPQNRALLFHWSQYDDPYESDISTRWYVKKFTCVFNGYPYWFYVLDNIIIKIT